MSKAPTLRFERTLRDAGHRLVAGCDEVGRGALAGPVSVGMVVVDVQSQKSLAGVRDSKLLKAADREALVPLIRRWAVGHAVGHASAAEVDALGLTAALRLAGTRAWLTLAGAGCSPDIVLLDGSHNWLSRPVQEPLFAVEADDGGTRPAGPACEAPVVTRIKADLSCLSVAAASVLAKVERDGILTALHAEHPQYGWAVNKGYATAVHRAAIAAEGPSPYHRLSWRLGEVSGPAAAGA
ncbi:MAG: ribonuclease HII [Actinomycetales bacterium]